MERVYHSGMVKLAILFALVLLSGCSQGALLQCRVDAVSVLPLEADAITLGDLKEVVRRVHACQAGDAGP